ncbi:unnamed protein product [Clavelina lepadiformis]|uniref:Uncharacterized protein n=1 Tax=Clavelina lepadiformis TaxID=159417 RepID=A0ABP0GBG5_CLALP
MWQIKESSLTKQRRTSQLLPRRKCAIFAVVTFMGGYVVHRDLTCNKCGKIGSFLRVFKSEYLSKTVATVAKVTPTLCAIYLHNLLEAALMISIRDQNLCALVDSGSSDNYINAVTA